MTALRSWPLMRDALVTTMALSVRSLVTRSLPVLEVLQEILWIPVEGHNSDLSGFVVLQQSCHEADESALEIFVPNLFLGEPHLLQRLVLAQTV